MAPDLNDHSVGGTGAWLSAQLVMVILLPIVVSYSLVTFLCRKVFLTPVSGSRWTLNPDISGGGESVLLVGEGTIPDGFKCYVVDLATLIRPTTADENAPAKPPADRWSDELGAIDGTEAPHIVIANIDARMYDPALSEKKLTFIEQVVLRQNRPVILTTRKSPREIVDAIPILRERWDALFASFIVGDHTTLTGSQTPAARPETAAGRSTPGQRWNDRLSQLWQAVKPIELLRRAHAFFYGVAKPQWQRRLARLQRILDGEAQADAALRRICNNIEKELDRVATTKDLPTSQDLLDQISRRAAAHYRQIWTACTTREKLVLSHIAEDGLANAKSDSIIRILLAKGLLRSGPDFRLMNTTFERFVLSGVQHAECVRYEARREASKWDRFQWPFAAAMIGGCLFFVLTQKELFDSTLASLATLATTVPALVRAIGLSREGAATASARNQGGDQLA